MHTIKFKEIQKYCNEIGKYKIPCKCGHKVVILPTQKMNYKICSWCGRKVYKDNKSEFIDKLNIQIRKGRK